MPNRSISAVQWDSNSANRPLFPAIEARLWEVGESIHSNNRGLRARVPLVSDSQSVMSSELPPRRFDLDRMRRNIGWEQGERRCQLCAMDGEASV